MIEYYAFLAIAALALSAIGTATSIVGGIQEGEAQKAAQGMRRASLRIEAARERTRQIRAARIARAQVVQAGANSGTSESSSVQAGAAGALAAGFHNITGINQQESAGIGQSRATQGVQDARGIQSLGSGLATLGGTIFNNQDELNDIFGIKKEA